MKRNRKALPSLALSGSFSEFTDRHFLAQLWVRSDCKNNHKKVDYVLTMKSAGGNMNSFSAELIFIYQFWKPVSETDSLTQALFFVVFYSFFLPFLYIFTK